MSFNEIEKSKKYLPDFIIIGAMKCATSSVHDQLARQANIVMSDPKEPNFFSDDEIYHRGIDWYRAIFSERKAGLHGESSTHYTKFPTYPHTIERMKKSEGFSSLKLIYIIRHPIDRLISQYLHEWSVGKIKEDINTAVFKYSELVNYSRYHYQLEHYLKHVESSQVLILFFESIKAAPQRELEKIGLHLGYNGNMAWDTELKPSNVSSERVRKFPLFDIFVNTKPMIVLRRSFVPKRLRSKIRKKLTQQKRPTLNQSSLQYLSDIFDSDLTKLGQLLGTNITLENYYSVVRSEVVNGRIQV